MYKHLPELGGDVYVNSKDSSALLIDKKQT